MTRSTWCALAVSVCASVLLLGAARLDPPQLFYRQHNLVSDGFIAADHTDPNLVNAWGLQFNPTGPWWVADNGTGVSTLYDSAGNIVPLVVTIAAPKGDTSSSKPTGI